MWGKKPKFTSYTVNWLKLQEDTALIHLLQSGDPSAYRVLVKLYKDRVYNTCYSFLKRQDLAEDQAQEVFIAIFRSIGSFEGKSKLSTWIYKIAVTKCLDHIRTQHRQKRRANGFLSLFSLQHEIPEEKGATPYEHLSNKESGQAIAEAIDALPEKYKTVFILKYMEGLSQQEIAIITESTEKSVEGILTRSRQQLKEKLKEYYREMKESNWFHL